MIIKWNRNSVHLQRIACAMRILVDRYETLIATARARRRRGSEKFGWCWRSKV